ncbi:MAG: DUF4214 domain-containing protein [Pseudomonadota bacterium]
MATVAEQIQKVYIGLLGRAADQAGLDYWTDEIESGALTLEQLRANIVEEQDEYDKGIGDMSRAQAVNQLYQNLFNRSAEDEGLDYWVNGGGADVSFDQLVMALVDGASAADTLALDNKAQVAEYYTAQAGEDYVPAAARAAVDDVDGDTDMADARADVDARIEQGAPNPTLTQQADNLRGTDGDDVFEAPVTQNETGSGALANTFETGDKIDGGEGQDVLRADLILPASATGVAISAETNSVEEVYFRAQESRADAGTILDPGNTSTIDAEKMVGVEQWWSNNSRHNIQIEDIRSNPADTAFGMRDTDPGTSFASFINANFLEGGTEVGESAFNFTIQEANALGDELQDITVNGIRFELNGESYELGGADVEAANTWAELETALQADLDATDGLEGLTVAHQGNGQFVVTDPEAGDFVVDPAGTVISSSTTNEVKDASLGTPDITELPTETDIVLDGAGNGSQGGAMNVGVTSGDRGVEVFNVNVMNDSHLATGANGLIPAQGALASSNLRTTEQYLEEVHVEGEGSLSLGSSTVGQNTTAGVSTTTDDRLQNDGLVDVRVFDASGYEQELKLGAALTNNAVGRYLDDADEPVQFTYNLGDGGSNFSLNLNNNLTTDNDFMLEINGGAQDDRINLSGNNYSLAAVSIDGGEGRNTLETSSSIGFTANNSLNGVNSVPANFENIQKLVLAGGGPVNADMTPLAGVEELVVATNGGANSQINDLEADTTVSLSGKNQTLGQNNSASDQSIGTVTLLDAKATTQRVDLDNTARNTNGPNTGTLTVSSVVVSESATGTSNVDELLLSSNGERNTTNVVQNIQANDASDVTFEGTQMLSAHVSSLATNNNQELTIDGSALESGLTLGVDATQLDDGSDDTVTGTDGDSDALALYGTLGDSAAGTDATVSGFETIQLGWLAGSDLAGTFNTAGMPTSGTYDAANTSDAGTYVLGALNGSITLDNLSGGTNVQVGDSSAMSGQQIGAFDQDITLSGSGSGAINVASVAELGSINFVGGAHNLMIDNFVDVNLDYARPDDVPPGAASTLNSGLQLDGLDPTATGQTDNDNTFDDGFEVDDVVNNLTITGGDADESDALVLEDVLPASLSSIDVSGYEGAFTATLANTFDSNGDSANTDTRFVLNDENANITLTDLQGTGANDGDGVDFNTVFEFTAAPAAQTAGGNPAATWTIDNFVAEDFGGAGNGNYSLLDLSDLGIGSFAELDFADAGGNVTITEEGGNSTWEIELTGVLEADLAPSENFIFA